MSALKIENLGKAFRPHFWQPAKVVLQKIDLEVPKGQIFGFLGPNGAGKTTTIKAILGLLTPDRGSISVLGGTMDSPAIRARVGFMPERAYYPEHLKAKEFLYQHAVMAGLWGTKAHSRCQELLRRVGLDSHQDKALRTFSKGMLQRVGLAQALVGDPDLIILDEPLAGLDPIGRRDLREIMLGLRGQGKTVLFSTHILPDVESTCDSVALIAQGQTRRMGSLVDIMGQGQEHPVEIVISQDAKAKVQGLNLQGLHVGHHGERIFLKAPNASEANKVVDTLRQAQITIEAMTTLRPNLEEIFVAEMAE